MKAILKWALIGIACLIVVGIAALLIIPRFIDASKYRAMLEQYAGEATGRKVTVGDDVSFSLFPWAGVSFSNLRVGNPQGFAEPEFAAVQSFQVRVKLLPLLSKDVQVDRLVIREPRLFLITNKDGQVSWDFSVKEAEKKKAAPAAGAPAAKPTLPIKSLLVGELSLTKGSVALVDHRSESRSGISGLNLTLTDVSFNRPIRISFSAQVNNKPVSAEGRLGPLGEDLGARPVPFELKASAFGQLSAQLKGSLENILAAPRATLTIEVPEFSPRKLLAEAGQALPATADPKVLERLAFKAAVTADKTAASLTDGLIALDDSKLTFTFKATEFSKPDLAFDLNLDQINLDRYLPPKAEAKAGQPKNEPPAGEKKKADYAPLRKLVLNGSAKVGRLTVSNASMQDISLKIAARDGIISIDPFSMSLYQGKADGRTVVNLKGEAPATAVQLNMTNVQVNPLLKDVAKKDFLEGSTHARVELTMSGEDAERIKQTLNGKGEFDLKDGAIVGVDLAGIARNVQSKLSGASTGGPKPRTDFAALNVPFTLQNGVWNTPGAELLSPFVRMQAAGKADLVKETLDFRVEPKVVGTLKGQGDTQNRSGLMVPVIVSGTFNDPKFRPDLESVAKSQLKDMLSPGAAGTGSAKEKAEGLIKGLLPGKK
jgi:AsmA protein